MSETDSSSSAPTTRGRSSPAPGCLILSVMLIVFGGLIVLYTVVGRYQNRTIASFTEAQAARLDIPEPSAAEVEGARAKLELIRTAVSEARAERVLFSARDLNVLIASMDEASDFRGTTRVEGISEQGLSVAMSLPVRKGVFVDGFRYLNATFRLQPELRARTIAFRVQAITPAQGEIPQAFVDGYAALDLFRLDPELPAFPEVIPNLAQVYTEADQLVVETKTGQ